jgi:hypothetical protein
VLDGFGEKKLCGVCAPDFFAPKLMIEVSALSHLFDVCHGINVPLSFISSTASFSARIPAASRRHASPTTTATGMTAKSAIAIASQKSAT